MFSLFDLEAIENHTFNLILVYFSRFNADFNKQENEISNICKKMFGMNHFSILAIP